MRDRGRLHSGHNKSKGNSLLDDLSAGEYRWWLTTVLFFFEEKQSNFILITIADNQDKTPSMEESSVVVYYTVSLKSEFERHHSSLSEFFIWNQSRKIWRGFVIETHFQHTRNSTSHPAINVEYNYVDWNVPFMIAKWVDSTGYRPMIFW